MIIVSYAGRIFKLMGVLENAVRLKYSVRLGRLALAM